MNRSLLPMLSWTCVLIVAYAWKVHDIQGAGNLLAAFLWFGSALSLFMIFSTPTKPSIPLHSGFVRTYAGYCAWVLLLGLLWCGHFGYAALMALQWMGQQTYRRHFNADGSLKAAEKLEA